MNRERSILDMWRFNIADDRGSIHRCRMRGTIGWKNTYGSPVPPALLSDLKSAGRAQWTVAGAAMGASMGAMMIVGSLLLSGLHWPMWAHWLLVYSLIPVAWLVFDFLLLGPYVRPAYRRDHRRITLAHHCCPACLYNVAALQPDSDGCTVCPECGGAWRPASTREAKSPPAST